MRTAGADDTDPQRRSPRFGGAHADSFARPTQMRLGRIMAHICLAARFVLQLRMTSVA